MARKPPVALPDFELLKRQPKIPHVARVVAESVVPNGHGLPITYRVSQSRNGKSWWISASIDGLRMSNTVHTTVAKKAFQWIDAVKRGDVCVKK